MDNKFKCMIDNIKKEFEVLYTFKSTKTKKDYIIYSDNTYDSDNNLNIYASIYYPLNTEKELENIEESTDWEEVEEFLNKVCGVIDEE